MRITEIK